MLLLERVSLKHETTLLLKHNKKLSNLYGDEILRKQDNDNFINLSNINIDMDTKNIFNLGLNCHLKSKIDKNITKIEIEKLYNSIIRLEQ